MFTSLFRALPRLAVLTLMGVLLILLSVPVGRAADPLFAPVLFNLGLCMLALVAGDIALRVLQPNVDPQRAANEAISNRNYGAGLVYLGRSLFAAAVLLLFAGSTRAAEPPQAALQYLPLLKREQLAWWPDMREPSMLAAQIEQETCITLTHRMCWNPHAELRTKRERGVGFWMGTIAYGANGSVRFDALRELVNANPQALAGLSWATPYNPGLQLRALILKDRADFNQVLGAASVSDRMAFTLAGYNGGAGGVRSDRRMCAATPGCDASQWFGHVEGTSLKARQAVNGYGKSFFAINREYVRNVLLVRRGRYLTLDDA